MRVKTKASPESIFWGCWTGQDTFHAAFADRRAAENSSQ